MCVQGRWFCCVMNWQAYLSISCIVIGIASLSLFLAQKMYTCRLAQFSQQCARCVPVPVLEELVVTGSDAENSCFPVWYVSSSQLPLMLSGIWLCLCTKHAMNQMHCLSWCPWQSSCDAREWNTELRCCSRDRLWRWVHIPRPFCSVLWCKNYSQVWCCVTWLVTWQVYCKYITYFIPATSCSVPWTDLASDAMHLVAHLVWTCGSRAAYLAMSLYVQHVHVS